MPAISDFTWTNAIQLFAAVSALCVAVFFGVVQARIARQQAATAAAAALTARNRLKFDLFERRLAQYELVRDYLQRVVKELTMKPDTDSEFLAAIHPLGWLTDRSVLDYVHSQLRDKMRALAVSTQEVAALPPGPAAAAALIKQSTLQYELFMEQEALAKAFEPYLKLEH